MKIGLLGGTFNPPHIGHLRLGEEVAEMHGLERVILIPCFIPPHKQTKEIAPAERRLEMTGVACQGNPLLEVSDVEIRLGGPSYTVNTLELFKGFSDYETFFILGTDSLKDISSWKDYRRLFELCDFIVVERPGIGFDVAWAAVPPALRARFRRDGRRMIHSSSKALIRSDVVGLNISSTTIRALLSAGRSIRYLVSEPVRTYIIENHLYGC